MTDLTKAVEIQRHSFSLNRGDYKGNGVYTRKFKNSIRFEANAKLSMESFHMYNSFFNIKQEYGNNVLIYKWIDGTSYTFTIPDGYYEVAALDYFVKQECIKNNLYVHNSDNSEYLFFHAFETDVNTYTNKINIIFFPDKALFTSLGYHLPDNASWLSWINTGTNWNSKLMIQLNIGGLNSYFGMSSNLFPKLVDSVAKNYYYKSDITPNLLHVNSLTLTCNLLDSPYNIESEYLTSIRINNEFGGMISCNYSMDTRYTIRKGSYSEFTIRLLDENFLPFNIVDPNMSINLIIETS